MLLVVRGRCSVKSFVSSISAIIVVYLVTKTGYIRLLFCAFQNTEKLNVHYKYSTNISVQKRSKDVVW